MTPRPLFGAALLFASLLAWMLAAFPDPAAGQAGPLGAASRQGAPRLWVLREPDQLVEYDPATFQPLRSVAVPRDALRNPEWLSVNRAGQVLFDLDPQRFEYEGPDAPASRVWLWEGESASTLSRGWVRTETPAGAQRSVLEVAPRCILSADGGRLYWVGNETRKRVERESNLEFSVATTFRAWGSGLGGEGRAPIAELSFPPCECGTGVCEETCPEAEVWIPPRGLEDFFFVTEWIPGQLGSTWVSSYLYRAVEGEWRVQELPLPMERVLDAAEGGDIVVQAELDAACCGWDNESGDLTYLARPGRSDVIFDERARYANPDYDVSFFTSNASLSPDDRLVAFTVVATAGADADIRLASEGAEDSEELASIRRALADLPAVEVLPVAGPLQPMARIPGATLIGWVGEAEILVLEGDTLVAVDVASGSRRVSPIHVPGAARVFLR